MSTKLLKRKKWVGPVGGAAVQNELRVVGPAVAHVLSREELIGNPPQLSPNG